MIRNTLLFCTLSAAVIAQDTTAPARVASSFVPPGHRCEVVIDVAALVESGLLDDLKASPMTGMMLNKAREGLGVEFDTIKKVRMYPELPGGDSEGRQGGIAILETGPEFAIPKLEDFEKSTLAGFDVHIDPDSGSDDPDLWVDVAPGLKVFGSKHLVSPLLDGSKKAVPTAPELAAMAGGKGTLLNVAMMLDESMFGDESPFGEESGIEMPKIGVIRMRMEAAEDEDEPKFVLEVVARFGDQEGAAGKLVGMMQAQLAGMAQMPQMAMMKPVLDKLMMKADGKDAKISLNLGTSREMVSMVGSLLPMMMMGAAGPGGGGR